MPFLNHRRVVKLSREHCVVPQSVEKCCMLSMWDRWVIITVKLYEEANREMYREPYQLDFILQCRVSTMQLVSLLILIITPWLHFYDFPYFIINGAWGIKTKSNKKVGCECVCIENQRISRLLILLFNPRNLLFMVLHLHCVTFNWDCPTSL